MASVHFTANLRRVVDFASCDVTATTVREALDAVFDGQPTLRSYVLDEQGRLRKHVVVFVDGDAVRDRNGLSDAIPPNAELWVMQALSGG